MNEPNPDLDQLKTMLAEMAAETKELKSAAGGSITDVAADWLAAQYLIVLRQHLDSLPAGPERLKPLRQAIGDVAALQRAGHAAARLQLDREKLEHQRQKHRDDLAATQSKGQELRDPKLPLSDEDRKAIVAKVDEIFGLA
jgi:hypothetical protein